MSTEKTKPVALRMGDVARERLLRHGGTARAAVERLLDIADEHETCGPPRKGRTTSTRAVSTSTKQTPPTLARPTTVTYAVTVAGKQVYATTNRAWAEKRARSERVRRPADPVELVER